MVTLVLSFISKYTIIRSLRDSLSPYKVVHTPLILTIDIYYTSLVYTLIIYLVINLPRAERACWQT